MTDGIGCDRTATRKAPNSARSAISWCRWRWSARTNWATTCGANCRKTSTRPSRTRRGWSRVRRPTWRSCTLSSGTAFCAPSCATRSTVRSASSWPTIRPSRRTRAAGSCCRCASAASRRPTASSSTCAPSSARVRPATRPTARSGWRAPSTTARATSRPVGSNCRPPSPRSRSCCPSPSWTATPRRCSPTRPPRRASSATSSPKRSACATSSDSPSTSPSSTRSSPFLFHHSGLNLFWTSWRVD